MSARGPARARVVSRARMEAIFALGAMAFALATGGVVVGGAVLLARALQRAGGSSPSPAELGRAIGLAPQGTHDAVGEREGIRLHAQWTTVRRGSGKRRRTVRVMRYAASIDPPLRMGLRVGREGPLDELFDSIGMTGDVVVGDAGLDAVLRIHAIEGAHAAAVLADPAVRAALLAGAQYGSFGVTDDSVACGHDRWAQTPSEVAGAIERVHAIARSLRDARARARAPWELALDGSWGAIARTEAMQWSPEHTRLAARAGDAWVLLQIAVRDGRLITHLALRFDAPLGMGLRITRTGMGAQLGALLGAQDVQCGHAAFDDAFTVKAADAETARHVLAEGGADAIVQLASVMPELEVSDAGADASIGTVLVDARAAGSAMQAAVDLARALRGGGGRRAGAYR